MIKLLLTPSGKLYSKLFIMENKIKNIITLITVTSQEITINLQVLKVFLFCLSVQLSIKVKF